MAFDPINYEGQDRLAHIEKYVGQNTAAIAVLNGGGMPARYLLIPQAGGGIKAVNSATWTVDFSTTSTTDHSSVWQSAINALAIQNGGTGGAIIFSGQHIWANPVTLYPGIAIIGEGPLGNKGVQDTGARIKSTYNGATLVVTGVGATNRYFPYLSNFEMYGDSGGTKPLQNLIQFDASGGSTLWDCFMDHVSLFNAGQHCLHFDTTSTALKLWIDNCYFESAVAAGIHWDAGGWLSITNSYIFGSVTGLDITAVNSGGFLYVGHNRFAGNTSWAVNGTGHPNTSAYVGNTIYDNGATGSATPQMWIRGTTGTGTLVVSGNQFFDDRAGSAATYHLRLGGNTLIFKGTITGNSFQGSLSDAVQVTTTASAQTILVADNVGFNDTKGQLATPFQNGKIGLEGFSGGAAAPTASTAYKANCGSVYVASSGGTGVSITITDPNAVTVQSGLATFAGVLPANYSINFGGFSVAPTLYVGVT